MCAEVSLDHGKVAYLRGLVIPRALRVGQYSNTHFLYIKAYYQFSNTSHNLGVGQCECVGTPLVCSCACVCVCVCVCVCCPHPNGFVFDVAGITLVALSGFNLL